MTVLLSASAPQIPPPTQLRALSKIKVRIKTGFKSRKIQEERYRA